jgi:hypothetical protein
MIAVANVQVVTQGTKLTVILTVRVTVLVMLQKIAVAYVRVVTQDMMLTVTKIVLANVLVMRL